MGPMRILELTARLQNLQVTLERTFPQHDDPVIRITSYPESIFGIHFHIMDPGSSKTYVNNHVLIAI